MEIDNSMAQAFRLCPWFYYESYLRNGRGIQPIPSYGEKYGALDLGVRVHQLQENYYFGAKCNGEFRWPVIEEAQEVWMYMPHLNEELEKEARWMMDEYVAHYPSDNWEIIDVERTFKVKLPNSHHIYIGKIDLFIKDLDDGCFYIIDHKTEKRGSKSHIPQKLAVTDQGSLYLWAARKLYPRVDGMKYNILVRPSEKGREPPSFKERYLVERSEHEIEIAVRDISLIADHIEDYQKRFADGEWPANRDECYGWGYCDFYNLHRFGEDTSLILQHKFRPREEYLSLDGVEIVD